MQFAHSAAANRSSVAQASYDGSRVSAFEGSHGDVLRPTRRQTSCRQSAEPNRLTHRCADLAGLRLVEGWRRERARRRAEPQPRRPSLRLASDLARELTGFPRQSGTHPGGFVLTRDRLDEFVPVEPAAMAGQQAIEWDKDDIDALKFMKVDVLGLGMLGCMRHAFELLEEHRGTGMDSATIPPEDPKA